MSLEEACANCYKCFVDANVLIKEEIEYQHKEQEREDFVKAPNSYMLKYNLTSPEIGKELEKNSEFRRMIVAENDKVYGEKMDALKTLGEMFLRGFQRAKVKLALRACGNCDYSSPKIREAVKTHQ